MPKTSVIIPSAVVSKGTYHLGLLEIDTDPAASRYAVFARDTLILLAQGKPSTPAPTRMFVSKTNAANGVICAIIDDTGTYNIAASDGVTCALVDANQVSL